MSIFDMPLEDRRQYVAALLRCKPTDRSDRLNDRIDTLLKYAARTAEDWLRQEIQRSVIR